MKNKFGFTLAEVLITLVIVGVVAAMTIPNLIHNHEKRVWVEELKVNYQLLSDGFKRMLALEGASLLADTSVYQSIVGYHDGIKRHDGSCTHNSGCNEFYEKFGKYFSIAKKYRGVVESKYLNSDGINSVDGDVIVLANGAMLFNPRHNNTTTSSNGVVSEFYIDVNGGKGPNTFGRDVFWLEVYNNGLVLPYDAARNLKSVSIDNPELAALLQSMADNLTWRGTNASDNCLTKDEGSDNSKGFGCAARIIEQGWKMTY